MQIKSLIRKLQRLQERAVAEDDYERGEFFPPFLSYIFDTSVLLPLDVIQQLAILVFFKMHSHKLLCEGVRVSVRGLGLGYE